MLESVIGKFVTRQNFMFIAPLSHYPCKDKIPSCNNQGVCVNRNETHYRCLCYAGFTGADCTIDMDSCASEPCYHGNCTDLVGGFSCSCEPGYEGDRCHISKYILFHICRYTQMYYH